MALKFHHVGIPVTNKKPGMKYNEKLKVWATNPEDNEFSIEYLKFEEGTRFPGILHKNPHIAYEVDTFLPYFGLAQQVVFGPEDLGPDKKFAYILLDDTLIEIIAPKNE